MFHTSRRAHSRKAAISSAALGLVMAMALGSHAQDAKPEGAKAAETPSAETGYFSFKERQAQSKETTGTETTQTKTDGQEADEAVEKAERSCEDLLTQTNDTLTSRTEKREAMRKELRDAAQKHPLVLAMADGSFVFLGDESAEMAEPFGSWFTDERSNEELSNALTEAQKFLDSGDQSKCLDTLGSFTSQ